jgi:hypothetical protein
VRFDYDWKVIAFNFLIRDDIERRGTRMERILNMDYVLKVLEKIYFDHQTLKIT